MATDSTTRNGFLTIAGWTLLVASVPAFGFGLFMLGLGGYLELTGQSGLSAEDRPYVIGGAVVLVLIGVGSFLLGKYLLRLRGVAPVSDELFRATQRESLIFITRMITAGLSAFVGAAIVVGFVVYVFAIHDNPDWYAEPGLYRFIAIVYFVAGIVSANTCGRYARSKYGTSLTPSIIAAIAVTLVMEMAIWTTFAPLETFIRSEYFSLSPNEATELSGVLIYGALCTVGWTPVFEARN